MCFAPQRRAFFQQFNFQRCSEHGFVRFDFEICFAPQRRALFVDLNFQKRCDTEVFCSVWFVITQLTRCLPTHRFNKPTFRPSGATKHWKNTVLPDLSTYSRTLIFFLLTLSFLTSSLLTLSLLWLLSPLVHIVGSLTSKLPSTSVYSYIRNPQCIPHVSHDIPQTPTPQPQIDVRPSHTCRRLAALRGPDRSFWGRPCINNNAGERINGLVHSNPDESKILRTSQVAHVCVIIFGVTNMVSLKTTGIHGFRTNIGSSCRCFLKAILGDDENPKLLG